MPPPSAPRRPGSSAVPSRNPLQSPLLTGLDRDSVQLLKEVAMDKGQAYGFALWLWFFGAALAWSVLSLIERPLFKTK